MQPSVWHFSALVVVSDIIMHMYLSTVKVWKQTNTVANCWNSESIIIITHCIVSKISTLPVVEENHTVHMVMMHHSYRSA